MLLAKIDIFDELPIILNCLDVDPNELTIVGAIYFNFEAQTRFIIDYRKFKFRMADHYIGTG